jgi:hypothetical protein
MLGVIGIIIVLAGIAVVAMRGLNRSGRDKQTKMTLSTLSSMLAEYDVATGFRRQPSYIFLPDGANTHQMTGTDSVWLDADPATPKDPQTGEQWVEAPVGSVDEDAGDAGRLRSQAVLNTAIVIREMCKIPAVKAQLSKVPADSLMDVYEDASKTTLIGPVFLDGWNNPIIFVPKTGLGGVILGDPPAEYVVRSTKACRSNDLASLFALANARPYFASAGPDGSFGFNDVNNNGSFNGNDVPAGDDNIYSFGN